MNNKTTKDWMERLVENYRIPTEEEQKRRLESPKKVLTESQRNKILNRD